MSFKDYIPPALSGIVDLIWEHEIPKPGGYCILPSGKVEIIFPIHPVVSLEVAKIPANDNPVNNYSCFLSGLHTSPLTMKFNRFNILGIQMRPVAVKALFGLPLCEIRNYFLPTEDVMNSVRIMKDKLHSGESFQERAKWFEAFLLKKINETPELHHAIQLDSAIQQRVIPKHQEKAKSIHNIMGYSRTQTYRLFNDWFGVSAHSYLKLVQFIRSVESLHNKNLKLTDVGLDNGYYDQAHYIRDFRSFAGKTPGAYRSIMTDIPGQIFSTSPD